MSDKPTFDFNSGQLVPNEKEMFNYSNMIEISDYWTNVKLGHTNKPKFDFNSGQQPPIGFDAFKYSNWQEISDYWLSK